MSYLPLAGYVGQGMNKAAVDQSNARIARLREWQEERNASAGLRLENQFNEFMQRESFPVQGVPLPDQRIGQGQKQEQPQARATAGLQEGPAVEYDVTPNNSPAAPATPPIRPETQSRAPVNARERDAAAPTAEAAPTQTQTQTQEQVTGVTYTPGHETPPGGRTTAQGEWEVRIIDGQRRYARMYGVDEDEYVRRAQQDPAAAQIWLEQNATNDPGPIARGANLVRNTTTSGRAMAAGARRGATNLVGSLWNELQEGWTGTPTDRQTSEAALQDQAQRQAGVTTPETPASPETAGVSDMQEGPSTVMEQADDLMEAEPEQIRQAVRNDTSPSGIKTSKIMDESAFFQANPQHITPTMQHALNQREVMGMLGQYYAATNNVGALSEIMQGMASLDHSMFTLQGMQGVNEINNANDPRRASQVLSYYNGVPTQIVPHTDGTFHIEMNGEIVRDNLTKDQVSTLVAQTVSQEARNAATQMQQAYARRAMEYEFWTQEQVMELQRDIHMAHVQGTIDAQIEAFKARADSMGFKLHNSADGSLIAIRTVNGQADVLKLEPEVPPEQHSMFNPLRWFGIGGAPDEGVAEQFRPIPTPGLSIQ